MSENWNRSSGSEIMESETFFYSILSDTCSCRDEYGDLKRIGNLYKIYYTSITSGESPIEVLKRLDINRMCCRSRFLSMPTVPMIDRSKDRVIDLVTNTNRDTAPIYPRKKNDFPIIHDKQVRKPTNSINIVSKYKVVPPKVDVKGSLPDDF
jgi:DNA-directed RNA polymerase subunit N (RpoN/RPB10)